MPSPLMHHEPKSDLIRAACEEFLERWKAKSRKRRKAKRPASVAMSQVVASPVIVAPTVVTPAKVKRKAKKRKVRHTAEWLSEKAGRTVKARGKGVARPAGLARYQGSTWNRFHAALEFKIKVRKHSYHLGYYPVHRAEEGALRFDRVAYRVWGNRALRKLNFADHEQLRTIVPDGVPADPLAGERKSQ